MALQWDPSPIALSIPGTPLAIHWYGVFFAFGLLISFLLYKRLVRSYAMKSVPQKEFDFLMDKFALFGTIGMLFFARLFHCLFYDWNYFQTHPEQFFFLWNGGLASHGALVGLFLGIWWCYKRYSLQSKYSIEWVQLIDSLALACFPATVAIRIGNFFNQEIVGTPTASCFGVLFQHPLGIGLEVVPRHPVQLYEAIGYALLGLFFFFKRKTILQHKGLGSGLVLVSFFTLRFFLEYIKAAQAQEDVHSFLSTGQELSIPCIALGMLFIYKTLTKHCHR